MANCLHVLASLLQSVADFLREKPAINQRSQSGQKGRQIGRNELSLNRQSRRKGEEKVSEIGQVQNLPKTEAYPLSSPPCYIDIPTQNFLVVLGTYDVLRNKTPPHQQDDEGASLVDYIKPMGPR